MMNLMTILASLMIMLIMILAHEEEEAAAGVPVFTFGDSLSDVGNNNYIPFSVLKSNFVPYGVDYPMKTPTGRFSNGLLVLDIVGMSITRLYYPSYYMLFNHRSIRRSTGFMLVRSHRSIGSLVRSDRSIGLLVCSD